MGGDGVEGDLAGGDEAAVKIFGVFACVQELEEQKLDDNDDDDDNAQEETQFTTPHRIGQGAGRPTGSNNSAINRRNNGSDYSDEDGYEDDNDGYVHDNDDERMLPTARITKTEIKTGAKTKTKIIYNNNKRRRKKKKTKAINDKIKNKL